MITYDSMIIHTIVYTLVYAYDAYMYSVSIHSLTRLVFIVQCFVFSKSRSIGQPFLAVPFGETQYHIMLTHTVIL